MSAPAQSSVTPCSASSQATAKVWCFAPKLISQRIRLLPHLLAQFFLTGALLLGGTQLLACGPPARGTIGAVLVQRASGQVFVRDVPERLAAYRAGIRPGDELLFIEGEDVRRLSDADLHRLLSGAVGEPVQLTLARGEQILRLTIKRSMAEAYRVQ